MAKANRKAAPKKEQPLKIKGSFEDVIAASVKNIEVKKEPKKKEVKKKG